MEEVKNSFHKLKLIKGNILKRNYFKNFQKSYDNDILNENSNTNFLKNNLNSSRKLKTKLNIKKIILKENSKRNYDNLITKLKEMKNNNNSMRSQKSMPQMAKEIAEQNMSNYLDGNYDYDFYEEDEQIESESKVENEKNYKDKEVNKENISKVNEAEKTLIIKNSPEEKKLIKNYSQDFITLRNRKSSYEKIIKQYERFLIKNKLAKISIKIKNKNYQDMLNSYSAMSQNKLIYDNIIKNYKETMISQYSSKIDELNRLYKINEKNKKQNIKIFTKITRPIENNNKTNYYEYEDEQSLDLQNQNFEYSFKDKTNISKKRNRIYLLKNIVRYPIKNFPGSLSEFAIAQEGKNCILFGGHNSGKNPNIWKFNSSNISWNIIKAEDTPIGTRYGHTSILKNGNLYVYGGEYPEYKTLANFEIFNLESRKWISPSFKTKYNVCLRKNHIACSIGNCMFIQGGIDEKGEFLNDCYILNYQPLMWKIIRIKKTRITIPCLAYHCCCLVLPSELRKDPTFTIYKRFALEKLQTSNIKEFGIYIFGGKMSEEAGDLNQDLYVLKIGGKSLEWIKLKPKGAPPKGRYGASMSFYEDGNILIIHGGRNDAKNNFVFNDTFILDLFSLNWMKVDYFDKEKKPGNRYFHQSFVEDNFFYVFGGMNGSSYSGSEMFILDLDSHKSCLKMREQYKISQILNKSKRKNKILPPINSKNSNF